MGRKWKHIFLLFPQGRLFYRKKIGVQPETKCSGTGQSLFALYISFIIPFIRNCATESKPAQFNDIWVCVLSICTLNKSASLSSLLYSWALSLYAVSTIRKYNTTLSCANKSNILLFQAFNAKGKRTNKDKVKRNESLLYFTTTLSMA